MMDLEHAGNSRQLAEPLDITLPKVPNEAWLMDSHRRAKTSTAPRPKSSCAAANHRPTLIHRDPSQARQGKLKKAQKRRNIMA